MSRFVVATAGHVDHGKSTLVGALTGIDTDRWAEEKRRGLTIDLGFAWMRLPSGSDVAFVDVPGHERFLGNMLAGLGPAPVVMFVIAADEGWQAQSDDHRDAIAALGIEHGLIVITRADLAPERVEDVIAQARRELGATGLAHAPALAVSARTGEGIAELTEALDAVLSRLAPADEQAPVRLWIDRAFSITGAGTVITGTLPEGSIVPGQRLDLISEESGGELVPVTVRGLQSEGQSEDAARPVSRTAVNLRGIAADRIARGDVLVAPGAFQRTAEVDVRRTSGEALDEAPREVLVHVGSASLPARLRSFDADHARIRLPRPLPLRLGDRLVLRGTGERAVLGGVQVLDADPPELARRGEGRRRTAQLHALDIQGDVTAEVERRGAVREEHLRRMGIRIPAELPAAVRREGPWLITADLFTAWTERLRETVTEHGALDALSAGVPRKAAIDLLGLPDASLLAAAVREAGLVEVDGRIRGAQAAQGLGAAERAVAELEKRLGAEPFSAPEADDLAAARLGVRELAAAERLGRLLRLGDGVVLLPSAPALAMRELAALPQPFTLSQARQALGTTRRVAVPLLEHLDARGWTRRIDGQRREVVRGGR